MDTVGLIGSYGYVVLFFGMFLFGETIFLPAAYLSLQGQLDPFLVILVSGIATLIADFVWYYLGSKLQIEKIRGWKRIKKNQHYFDRLSELFDVYGYYVLLISKFVYGTRVLVQVISGIKKVPVLIYMGINTLGTFSFLILLFFVTFFVNSTFAALAVNNIKIGIVAVLLIGLLLNLCIHFIARKKMSL